LIHLTTCLPLQAFVEKERRERGEKEHQPKRGEQSYTEPERKVQTDQNSDVQLKQISFL